MGAPHKAMKDKSAGVILVNLGTPAEPTTASVRQFLREFLSDPRVVDNIIHHLMIFHNTKSKM